MSIEFESDVEVFIEFVVFGYLLLDYMFYKNIKCLYLGEILCFDVSYGVVK